MEDNAGEITIVKKLLALLLSCTLTSSASAMRFDASGDARKSAQGVPSSLEKGQRLGIDTRLLGMADKVGENGATALAMWLAVNTVSGKNLRASELNAAGRVLLNEVFEAPDRINSQIKTDAGMYLVVESEAMGVAAVFGEGKFQGFTWSGFKPGNGGRSHLKDLMDSSPAADGKPSRKEVNAYMHILEKAILSASDRRDVILTEPDGTRYFQSESVSAGIAARGRYAPNGKEFDQAEFVRILPEKRIQVLTDGSIEAWSPRTNDTATEIPRNPPSQVGKILKAAIPIRLTRGILSMMASTAAEPRGSSSLPSAPTKDQLESVAEPLPPQVQKVLDGIQTTFDQYNQYRDEKPELNPAANPSNLGSGVTNPKSESLTSGLAHMAVNFGKPLGLFGAFIPTKAKFDATVRAANYLEGMTLNVAEQAVTWGEAVSRVIVSKTESAIKKTKDGAVTIAKDYRSDLNIVVDFVGEKTSDGFDTIVIKYGGRIKEDPIDGYNGAINSTDMKTLSGHQGIEFRMADKPSDPGIPPSAVFEMRHSYRTPPVLSIFPHYSVIRMDRDEVAGNVYVLFNAPPAEFVDGLKTSKSINIFVHGYNVSSNESLKMQDAFMTLFNWGDYKNINASISWSGDVGNNWLSKLIYFNRSARSADISWEGVARTEQFVQSYNPDIQLNVVTHSLGGRLFLDAADNGVKFETMILIVPAVDNEVLSPGGKYEKAIQNVKHLVVVYSKNQEVVFGSYRLAQFDRALGEVGPSGTVQHPDFTAIDATKASNNPYGIEVNNHSDIYEPKMIEMLIDRLRSRR
ncbi:MAG: hypothetical protein KCHDKBKB_03127 [Elusimicrobia bacterium]|nr:hypothetical protein [Elusimicrobiota bacterium]